MSFSKVGQDVVKLEENLDALETLSNLPHMVFVWLPFEILQEAKLQCTVHRKDFNNFVTSVRRKKTSEYFIKNWNQDLLTSRFDTS